LLQWPSHESSSLRRRRAAHQRYKNAGCRTFQRRMKQLQPEGQRLRSQALLKLKLLREAAHLRRMFSWDDDDIEIFLREMTKNLEEFLNSSI
jgi:hypothetical protein